MYYMICSTLSGLMAIKHPELGVLVREDGCVLNKCRGNHRESRPVLTKGSLHTSSKDGHKTYRVIIGGKNYQVHRLVAECFIQNLEHRDEINAKRRLAYAAKRQGTDSTD